MEAKLLKTNHVFYSEVGESKTSLAIPSFLILSAKFGDSITVQGKGTHKPRRWRHGLNLLYR